MGATSVLSDGTIRRLVDEGRVVIDPWDPALVQPASVDLRLGDSFRVFHNHRAAAIDLRDPPTNLTEEVVIAGEDPFVIHPGEFCLGRTEEWVELPDDVVARIEGKSSLGRLGAASTRARGPVYAGRAGRRRAADEADRRPRRPAGAATRSGPGTWLRCPRR